MIVGEATSPKDLKESGELPAEEAARSAAAPSPWCFRCDDDIGDWSEMECGMLRGVRPLAAAEEAEAEAVLLLFLLATLWGTSRGATGWVAIAPTGEGSQWIGQHGRTGRGGGWDVETVGGGILYFLSSFSFGGGGEVTYLYEMAV